MVVRGAREHNLKSLDVAIPRDRLVVITGVSGSGKSSLAFDTIFAEGQRKYMESLSAYARQFLNQMQKPDVEEIVGLPPTIAIEQRAGGHTPRSTVATTTEIYDYLRLLMARCGTPTCWHRVGGDDAAPKLCGLPIAATPATQIVDAILAQHAGARLMLCAPVVRGRKGHHREVAEALQKQGFVRARVNGALVDLREALKDGGENPLGLGRYEAHSIDAIVDRLVPEADARQRLAESVEVALRVGGGLAIVLVERDGTWSETRYSERYACPDHPECAIDELEPRLFSFNSPHGACATCAGLGTVREFDLGLVIPDPELPVAEAIEPWRRNGPRMNMHYHRLMRRFCERLEVKPATPYRRLARSVQRILLNGTSEADAARLGFSFEGVLPNLHRRYERSESDAIKERLHGYMSNAPCPACRGRRLRPEALAVKLRGALEGGLADAGIAEIAALTIERAQAFFAGIQLGVEAGRIAEPILREINARLGFLASVGLGYLTLDRASATLSGGEAQRIRLATQVGSGLVGVCYVLDEPTIGLHQRDNDRLVATLRRLADIGNSVLVVEHDEDTIRAADHVVDIGPGPGRSGGRVVAQGSVADLCAVPASLTGQYLSGARRIALPARRRSVDHAGAIVVRGARENNLRGIDVAFPLGGIICVTGVSGSGKSTLVNDILLRAAMRSLHGSKDAPGAHERVNGLGRIERVVEVDQTPIGRTPRSNPATYTGMFDEIRRLFAAAKESKIRGYEPGRFSFNVKGGRCESCQGQGVRRIEMHFLPDVFVTCEVCRGARYNRETLDVRFKGRTIAEVLDMTVGDALPFFEPHPRIHRYVECLHDVGLDYIQLGQPATTLSGGEAQRIKLASELSVRRDGTAAARTLYILDEPTTGLHFADVDRLLSVLQRLADGGQTLVVIEHNLDVIKCADWIIDLGPEGGDRGGTVVAVGTPEDLARHPASFTGAYLRPMLAPRAAEVA
ncbi:MAG TPA: excinuclease ABC subunit UvrA [Phycisphaerales bacterium]|nr:excinuclease ABC subunit UvrA [Phycisphaerales bacterium]HMP36317.1 excinuclease ABC subunit UvrA [Phycisphaerales bacterium]